MSLASTAAATGRKVYVPSSGRRAVLTDPWHVIAKREKFAARLREILYGSSPTSCPSHRTSTWAWLIREFVHLRDFRYVELLDEARSFVKQYGHVESVSYDEELDLDLLKAFQQHLYRRRAELQTWRNREQVRDPKLVVQEMAAREAKDCLLLGVCPLCGSDLPCSACGTPEVVFDGKGGLVAK